MVCHVPQRFLRKLARMQHRRTRWVPRAVWQAFDQICGQVECGALREHLAEVPGGRGGDGRLHELGMGGGGGPLGRVRTLDRKDAGGPAGPSDEDGS